MKVLVDNVVHAILRGEIACGLVLRNRDWGWIREGLLAAGNRNVDCMTCLVAEARSSK